MSFSGTFTCPCMTLGVWLHLSARATASALLVVHLIVLQLTRRIVCQNNWPATQPNKTLSPHLHCSSSGSDNLPIIVAFVSEAVDKMRGKVGRCLE